MLPLSPSFDSPAGSVPRITTGLEWVVDAERCDPGKLQSLSVVRRICDRIIDDLGLKVIGEHQSHRFPEPGGVTVLYLLSESHLTAHTYPEHQIATFNLYCCRRRNEWPWQNQLSMELNADEVKVRCFDRGSFRSTESTGDHGFGDAESAR